MTTRILALVVLAALTLGCGDAPPSVSAEASQLLTEQVGAVRAAAAGGDAAGAEAQLAALRVSVEDLHRAGDVDAGALQRITAALDDVQAQLGGIPTTTTAPPPNPTTTTTPPLRPAEDDGTNGEGKGNDKSDEDKDD